MSPDGDVTDAEIPLWHHRLRKAARVMLGSFPLNQLEHTSKISLMLSLHFVQSLRIIALTVFNASCLDK